MGPLHGVKRPKTKKNRDDLREAIMPSPYRHAITALFLAVMLGAAVAGILAPYRNWDMLCYVASVSSWRLDSPQSIYDATISDVAGTTPDWIVTQFLANPLSSSAKNFNHVLPMCQVKPLYNALLWAISKISGIPLSTASSLVSAIAFAIASLVLVAFPLKECPRPIWLIAILALAFAGPWPLATLARMSTPDSLCLLLTMVAFLGLLRRHELLFSGAALLASLTRPDAAILMMCLTIWTLRDCWISSHRRTWMILAGGLVLVAFSQVAVSYFAHSYSFEKMFYYTFVNRTSEIASLSGNLVSTESYLNVLSYGFNTMLGSTRFCMVAGTALLGAIAHYLAPAPLVNRHRQILGVCWTAFAIRFTVWPASGEDRFYFGYFLISLCCSIELMAPLGKICHAALLDHRASLIERYRGEGTKS